MSRLKIILHHESIGGLLLLLAALCAMTVKNSSFEPLYDALLNTPIEVSVGTFEIAKPLLLWVNDGLMAIFFFLIGLELKREMLEGHLARRSQVILPTVAAVGGMIFPALIYVFFNWQDSVALKGWAIPSATDIAFALGVLSLLGKRVPSVLKIFLLTLAIVDDLGAIMIIALFYTHELSLFSLLVALVVLPVLALMNRIGVTRITPYFLVGMVLWVALLESGVHATLAGVFLALFIPLHGKSGEGSPLRWLERDLHPTVVFAILPMFAFANTGVSLSGLSLEALLSPIPVGIAMGLFLGNQLGVFGFVWLSVRLGFAQLPDGVRWVHMYGVAALCGIGFTMSLFISSLAFHHTDVGFAVDDRLGILLGSLFSALLGYTILYMTLPKVARSY